MFLQYAFGVFIILHGLVWLLYMGQSQRIFELKPGMVWPENSWALAKLLRKERTKWLASSFCVAAAIGFVAAGVGILFGLDWWRPVVIGTAVFASSIPVLFWDGKRQQLADQGFVGLLINLLILFAWLVLN